MFAAAKAENETRNEADKVWVIGVDRDQSAEGAYTSKDGKESNFVLASTLKQVGAAVKILLQKLKMVNSLVVKSFVILLLIKV